MVVLRSSTHQHGCPQVEEMEELRHEDVRLDDRLGVALFDALEDVDEPLELLLTRRHPDEVQLHNTASTAQ